MRLKILLTIMLLCVAMSAAAKLSPYHDPNKPIIVSKHAENFSISLPSNPTTGFSWHLKSYDADLIKPIKQKYQPPKKHLLGAGGIETFSFEVNDGALNVKRISEIVFVYLRPWKMDVGKTVTFNVISQ